MERAQHAEESLTHVSEAVGLERREECGPHAGEAGVGQFLRSLESEVKEF